MTGLIVHEWIEKFGGAEKVLDAMTKSYPKAPIRCLWNDAPERYSPGVVTESWMAKTPLRRHKALALGAMPSTWKATNIRDFDWVLVSSHLFAHHVGGRVSRQEVPVFVYAHTPARYIWSPELDSRGDRALFRGASNILRRLDKRAAQSGASYAANSQYVQSRMARTWEVDAKVIYPPVSTSFLQSVDSWQNRLVDQDEKTFNSLPSEFILGASRFVEYKKLDTVIEVGEKCRLPVVLAGSGPELGRISKRAMESSVPVTVINSPSNDLLYALYEKALVYVFPPVEDFGIMPVEAIALGTPVLVNSEGGAAETVALTGGGSSLNFASSLGNISEALEAALAADMRTARLRAHIFSEEAFMRNVKSWMGQTDTVYGSPDSRDDLENTDHRLSRRE